MATVKHFIGIASLLIFAITLPCDGILAMALRAHRPQEKIKVFYTESDSSGWTAVPRGEVHSIGVREDAHSQELMKFAQSNSRATVRLYSSEGLRKGDELFVVNARNLVVARIDVKLIYQDHSFGPMLIGYGNFRYAGVGFKVVQKVDDAYSKYAYIYKARGDYFKRNGEYAKAIELYKKSIEMDRRYPEAHSALGYLYLRDEMMPFAMKEFSEAYREIDRIYDNEEKYMLLKGLTTTRYRMAYEYTIPAADRKKYISEGIKYAEEALKIFPGSRDMNLYLGIFYYRGPEPQDVKAKNQFQKLLEIDPLNATACLALAELYRKHDNPQKARMYARKALEARPDSVEARRLLDSLQ